MASYKLIILNQDKNAKHDEIIIDKDVNLPDDDAALAYATDYEKDHDFQTVLVINKSIALSNATGYVLMWKRHFPVVILSKDNPTAKQ